MIWLESRMNPQYERDGKLGVLHGVVQDVTEQQRLRAENERLQEATSSMRKITAGDFWRADPQGHLIDFAGWMQFTGHTAEQLRDYGSLEAVHPDDRQKFRASWENAIRQRQRHELSVRVRRHDGVYLRFENKIVPILSRDGEVLEWHGMSWIADNEPARPSEIPELRSGHIRAARGLLDISAQDLAAASGVSFSTIRRLEAGKGVIKEENLAQVRRELERRGVRFHMLENGQIAVALLSR